MNQMFFHKFLSIVAFLWIVLPHTLFAQTKSPKEFLGYEIGDRFTPHHQIVAYFEHVAATNPMVKLVQYGETYEHRPLISAFVSSNSNIQNLEKIRLDNLNRAGMGSGETSESLQTSIPIVWMSYNVHGNEAVGSETAMMTLWALIDPAQKATKNWLEKTLVVIDPCLNPDGHSRYVNWYMQKANKRLTVDPNSMEHFEPWPGGRPNHYLFDLNRDWAWQVQQESQQRNVFYHQWMPQIHVDFHEQGVNSPYFFAPAAEPIHVNVAPYQMEFQNIIGKHIASAFDQHAWLYFTRELFDLFYPSYGDTWPTFNGAIGMTFEQGGSGRAGLGILTDLKDTLTLHDRIIHHHTSGLATIEVAYNYHDKILKEFASYFKDGAKNPVGKYRSYLVKAGKTPEKVRALAQLLDKNGIQYQFVKQKQGGFKGYRYFNNKVESFSADVNDLLVSAYQPKSVLTQTLFDPNPVLKDSATYDITSWALPYVYGLETYASETRLALDLNAKELPVNHVSNTRYDGVPLAYVFPWTSAVHGKFLSKLLDKGVRVRFSTKDFEVSGKSFDRGSIIIGREGNERIQNFQDWVLRTSTEMGVEIQPVYSGYVEKGSDFGSSEVRAVKAPKIAVVGSRVSSLSLGEIWHYLEQELDYPFTMLEMNQLNSSILKHYEVLILPSGSYSGLGEAGLKELRDWVAEGGKIIAIENALNAFVDKKGFALSQYFSEEKKKEYEKEDEKASANKHLIPYASRLGWEISNGITGAIFEVKVDNTHPLAYGIGDKYFTIRMGSNRYAYIKTGDNVGIIPDSGFLRSGFMGSQTKNLVQETLAFGVESIGKGQIVYFVDNPLFRGFWENGKQLFNNALFIVGQ